MKTRASIFREPQEHLLDEQELQGIVSGLATALAQGDDVPEMAQRLKAGYLIRVELSIELMSEPSE